MGRKKAAKVRNDIRPGSDGHLKITPEEVARELESREGGRTAGRGDSPWTQEFYEETYGINGKKRGSGAVYGSPGRDLVPIPQIAESADGTTDCLHGSLALDGPEGTVTAGWTLDRIASTLFLDGKDRNGDGTDDIGHLCFKNLVVTNVEYIPPDLFAG